MTFTTSDSPVLVHQDVYSWMSARIHVFDHPWFATTGDDGTFTIADVPPGTHTLHALHETFGEAAVEITVTSGETVSTVLTLSPR